MEDEDNVLFVRGTSKNTIITADDDVWDDTALIRAYDKAVNLAKDEVAKRIGTEIESTGANSDCLDHKKSFIGKTSRKWTIGAPCRATYSNDGKVYEAIVTKIYENTGTCLVTFVGYGNTEKVELSKLRESNGLKSQIEQQKNCHDTGETSGNSRQENSSSDTGQTNGSLGEHMDYECDAPRMPKNIFNPGSSFNFSPGNIPPAPHLPPQWMLKLPDNDADALSSMLMSWYISGFHTGYYHGIKQARKLEKIRKK